MSDWTKHAWTPGQATWRTGILGQVRCFRQTSEQWPSIKAQADTIRSV